MSPDQKTIVMGSDHLGYSLKEELKAYIIALGHVVVDIGTDNADDPIDYPDVAVALARRVKHGEFDRGILICGTGIGMAMTANKIPGVRAAAAHDTYSAERARRSNDAQVLTLGSQVVGPAVARNIIDHWLVSEFDGGRSAPKVAKIKALDQAKGP